MRPTGGADRLARHGVGAATVAGTAASLCLVLAAGHSAVPVGVHLEPALHGLLAPSTTGGTTSAALVAMSLAVLVASWWVVLDGAARGRASLRRVAAAGAVWAVPILLAPPLLSLDAYAYLAQGDMLAHGLDPYRGGPVLLGPDVVAGRVDPMWRSAPAPYGPLGLLAFRAVDAVSHDLTSGVLLLRLLALLGVAAAVLAALQLCPRPQRAQVLALTALNPITLVHLVGGVHLDALLAGLTATCALALSRHRPWTAWALAAGAVAVKITALPLAAIVLLCLRRRADARHVLAGAVPVAALALFVSLPVVHRPWGFVSALGVSGSSAPWYAPSSLLTGLLIGLARLGRLPATPATLHLVAVSTTLAVGAVLVVLLLRAEREDAVAVPRRTLRRAGLALLIVIGCLPALYAWYLGAALFLLVPVAGRRVRMLVVALSSALAFGSLPPLYGSARWPLVLAALTAATVLVGCGLALLRQDRAAPAAARRLTAAPVAARAPRRSTRSSARSVTVRYRAAAGAVAMASLLAVLLTTAGADTAAATGSTLARQAHERLRLVALLRADYPSLQVVEVDIRDWGHPRYQVEMAAPGLHTCQILLDPGPGRGSAPVRLPPARGVTTRATDARSCPSPASRPRTGPAL